VSLELEKLMKMFAAVSPGVDVNVGPGLAGFMGFSSTDEMKKHVDEMKAFMEKDVQELASKEGDTAISTLDVRGRKMVIPQNGPRRQTSIIFACLYALENFAIDQILWGLQAKAHFVAKDGAVELALMVEKPIQREEPPKAHAPLSGRNILIGEEQDQKVCFVGVKNVSGKFCRIGIPLPSTEEGAISVKLASGQITTVPKELVVWVSDEKQLLEIMTEIAGPKQ